MDHPGLARLLGYAGLLPFAGLAVSAVTGLGPTAAVSWFVGYSAVILSFLGGIRWGLTAASAPDSGARDMVIAIVISLWGWAAMLLPDQATQVSILLAGHAAALAVDRGLPPVAQPPWLSRLRVQLSVVAILCHGVILALT